MKLGIGLPLTDDTVPTQFFVHFTVMEKGDFTLIFPRFRGEIWQNRNDIVHQAQLDGITHLLMMDTDQTFPYDTIAKLTRHDVFVVAGIVHRRYAPFEPIALVGEPSKYRHLPDEKCYSGELVEIDAIGTGCILYDMTVFKIVPEPWFELRQAKDGKLVGEDIGMCQKIKKAGFKIYADTSVQCGHLSMLEVTRGFYKLFRAVNPKLEWKGE